MPFLGRPKQEYRKSKWMRETQASCFEGMTICAVDDNQFIEAVNLKRRKELTLKQRIETELAERAVFF